MGRYFKVRTSFPNIFFSIWVYRLVRIMIGLVFVYSGITKISSPHDFAEIIEAYGIVPDNLVLPLSYLFPLLEILAGAGLVIDLKGTLGTIASLLLIFAGVLIYGIWMRFDLDCGCFGPSDPEAQVFHGLRYALLRDIGFLGAVSYLYFWRHLYHSKKAKNRSN